MNGQEIFFKGIILGTIFGIFWGVEVALGCFGSNLLIAVLIALLSTALMSHILADSKIKNIVLEVLIGILPAFLTFLAIYKVIWVDVLFLLGKGKALHLLAEDELSILFKSNLYFGFTMLAPVVAYYIGKKRKGI